MGSNNPIPREPHNYALPPDLQRVWDVIVIGTGIGGSTVGHALAQRGLSVLFLEKGGRVEQDLSSGDALTPEIRQAHGWWPYVVSQRRPDGRCDRFHAPVGCALGGSSIFYAAALERMAPSDFEALQTSSQKVAAWPIAYEEFLPFYARAESLYGIVPFSDAEGEARFSEWDRALMKAMRENGLKPERLNVGIRYDENCQECIGRICPRRCKSDARTACLDVALRQPRCFILDHCDVQRLDADDRRVHAVCALYRGEEIELQARVIVLAAGALHSPQILLRSRNSFWPNGLANRSDQVGRNLMFHTSDLVALWAPRRFSRKGRQKKSISVRDFYVHNGQRLGYVQSLGFDAGTTQIRNYLKDTLRRFGIGNERLLSLLVKVPAAIGSRVLGASSIFAAMTEDDPSPDNRIVLDTAEPDGASFTYTIGDELRQRADALRDAFRRSVRPWRMLRMSPRLEMNYGHPCGTCRFGLDPATSVLNRDCRAHDLENFYVVDASFMPRSGAVNPSLTIAANALRAAGRIAATLSDDESLVDGTGIEAAAIRN
jgi:choline dehydrogenase-like flavoprotein